MENLNLEEIKKMIMIYNSLGKKDKREINDLVDQEWMKVVEKFVNKCSADEKLNKLYDWTDDYKEITEFDKDETYKDYGFTEEEAKYIYENRDKLIERNFKKIDRIEKTPILRSFSDEKICDLICEVERVKIRSDIYMGLKRAQEKKELYLQKYPELFERKNKSLNKLYSKYADEVLTEVLKSNPGIACKEHKELITLKHFRDYDISALNEICNKVRFEVLKLIQAEKDKVFNIEQPGK